MSATVLAKGNVTVSQSRFNGREINSAQIFFAQQCVHRTGSGSGHEHAFGIHPAIALCRAPLMKTGRGAHSAMNSWESTGRSFQFSGPPYLMKFPAIQ